MSQVAEAVSEVKPWRLVTHRYPDTDAWACLWVADKFIVPPKADRLISFMDAGSRLSKKDEEGFEVLYMDTGLGDCDQHGRELVRASSFQLVLDRYGLRGDPGLTSILELTRATDNVEQISPTSIHYYFKGLPHSLRESTSREVDWEEVMERVFEVFDIIYGQARMRAESTAEFKDSGRTYKLPNDIWVSTVWWKPHLREAAFETGADVVMWLAAHGKNRFDVGIQVSRRSSVELNRVMRAIWLAEAQKRGISIAGKNEELKYGTHPLVPGWFLHDSSKLIVCGSRSHPLAREEFTTLSPSEILNVLRTELKALPKAKKRS